MDSGISKSEVSRICAELDETVEAFRGRPLDHTEFPYLFLDATYLKVRNSLSQVTSMAMVVATGVTEDGRREILGCDIGDSETEGFWQQLRASLRDRGLNGVRLVTADAHRGLNAAADRALQGAARQRCRVHFARNLSAACPGPTSTWPPRSCGPSSPNPTPPRFTTPGTKSQTSSPACSPKPAS